MKNKKKLILIMLLTLTLIGIPVVNAKTDTGFYADEKVEIEGEKDRTIFAAGDTIKVNSMVDGSSFLAGRRLTVNSSQDNLFAAGEQIYIENAGSKEVFAAGETITVKNSELRDIFVAGNSVTIEQSKVRDAYIGGSTVIIDSTFEGNVTVSAEKLIITENAVITGELKYPESAETDIASSATISKTKKYKTVDNESIFENNQYVSLLTASLSMILIALILLSTNKRMFKEMNNVKRSLLTTLNTTLKGAGLLLLIPIIAFILIDTVIGTPIGILLLLIYGVLFYLSAIPTAFYLGRWIIGDKIRDYYPLTALSIFVLYLLRMIPVVGEAVTLISLLLGFGLFETVIVNLVKKQDDEPKKEIVEEAKVVETVEEKESKEETPKKTKTTTKKKSTKKNNLKEKESKENSKKK